MKNNEFNNLKQLKTKLSQNPNSLMKKYPISELKKKEKENGVK